MELDVNVRWTLHKRTPKQRALLMRSLASNGFRPTNGLYERRFPNGATNGLILQEAVDGRGGDILWGARYGPGLKALEHQAKALSTKFNSLKRRFKERIEPDHSIFAELSAFKSRYSELFDRIQHLRSVGPFFEFRICKRGEAKRLAQVISYWIDINSLRGSRQPRNDGQINWYWVSQEATACAQIAKRFLKERLARRHRTNLDEFPKEFVRRNSFPSEVQPFLESLVSTARRGRTGV